MLHDIYCVKDLFHALFWILDFLTTESLAIDFQTRFLLGPSPGGFVVFFLLRELRMIQIPYEPN
jgi:hypothetical protein